MLNNAPDDNPTELRCPHCEAVIPSDWILNICPQCGRSVPLEELRRAASVEVAPTEQFPPSPMAETPLTDSAPTEAEPVETSAESPAPETLLSDLPFDTESFFESDAVLPTRPCLNHPSVESTLFCPLCGKPHCDNCVVEFRGRKICSRCKDAEVMTLQHQGNFQTATTALFLSIIGTALGSLCCLPYVCSLIGLVFGYQALQEMRRNPDLLFARPTALAALIIGWVGIGFASLQILYGILAFVLGASTTR